VVRGTGIYYLQGGSFLPLVADMGDLTVLRMSDPVLVTAFTWWFLHNCDFWQVVLA
jgi:hypothetical protein